MNTPSSKLITSQVYTFFISKNNKSTVFLPFYEDGFDFDLCFSNSEELLDFITNLIYNTRSRENQFVAFNLEEKIQAEKEVKNETLKSQKFTTGLPFYSKQNEDCSLRLNLSPNLNFKLLLGSGSKIFRAEDVSILNYKNYINSLRLEYKELNKQLEILEQGLNSKDKEQKQKEVKTRMNAISYEIHKEVPICFSLKDCKIENITQVCDKAKNILQDAIRSKKLENTPQVRRLSGVLNLQNLSIMEVADSFNSGRISFNSINKLPKTLKEELRPLIQNILTENNDLHI